MIDTHAHLDLDSAAETLERAEAAGVTRVIVVATSLAGALEAIELQAQHPQLRVSLGIHPHNAETNDASQLSELKRLLVSGRAVAVGETGLDYYRDYASVAAQRELFDGHLRLATELSLPVVIHTRAADADTLDALSSFDGTVILHCFSSPGLLPTALERGWYVSFAGNVTYANASELRLAAKLVPVERILAETDSPYLAPQPVRGQQNEPAFVMHTVSALAATRGEDEAELERQIDANATAAFALQG